MPVEATLAELESHISRIAKDTDGQINEALKISRHKDVHNLLSYPFISGGKRLRPCISVITAQCFGGDYSKAIEFSKGIEMIHAGTLGIDDVMDKSPLRRGMPSMPQAFGLLESVIGCNALILEGVLTSSINPAYTLELNKIIFRLMDGNIKELLFKSFNKQEYENIISNKTAALFEAPAELGVLIADAPNHKTNAKFYGYYFGQAFQMADDLVDVYKSLKLGKPVGDILQYRITFPILLLYHDKETDDGVRAMLDEYRQKTLPPDQIMVMLQILSQRGILNGAENKIREYIEKSVERLSNFPDNKFRSMLQQLPSYMINKLMEEIEETEEKESESLFDIDKGSVFEGETNEPTQETPEETKEPQGDERGNGAQEVHEQTPQQEE